MSKNIDLNNRVAIVTGASRGIGKAITQSLAEAGANIVCVARTGQGLSELQKEIKSTGVKSLTMRADISKLEDIKEIVRAAIVSFGKIDILINNAGIIIRKSISRVTEEDWDTVINVNLKGVFFLTQEVGKIMIDQKYGKIINIASLTSFKGAPDRSVYAISKAGIVSLTKCFAVEWARYNIYVNAIAPGCIKTDLTKTLLSDGTYYDKMVNRIPLGRIGTPADIGDAVVFLASDASNYITGETLMIDGGFLSS